MLREDAGRRVPRRPWAAFKRAYSQNPGVELADITRERTDRYRTEQAAIKARLRANPRQPQDAFNPVTRATVATRAGESQRLNHATATADRHRPSPFGTTLLYVAPARRSCTAFLYVVHGVLTG